MASTSSSAYLPAHLFKHGVFLSFRGEDTRYGFISHLHSALSRKSITTFIDDKLRRGDKISQQLLNAIEESVFAVVVFSKGYASSTWCLDELTKIVECIDTRGQKVIPVFYHVDPSDVRKQTGTFAEAFVAHEANFNLNIERLQRWRAALTKAADLSGCATKDCRSESDIVDRIVRRIWEDLQKMGPSSSKGLVGIGPRIEQLQTLLCSESSGSVFILGLWGMGGIGKTTIAGALFERIKCRFERRCFLRNVREGSEKRGLETLEKELLSALLEEKIETINAPGIGQFFNMPCDRKILLVLDDVDDRKQLESLVGDRSWYGPESRIIITSRDRQLLNPPLVDVVYEVELLLHPDALQLFSLHAFKRNVPTDNLRELSSSFVRYAKGVPLTLEVLGSSLSDKDRGEWESALKTLEKGPPKEIQDVLRISYFSLEEEQRELFLWIACCLKGWSKDSVKKLLDDCDFSLNVLVSRSLLTVDKYEEITMHDLLEEMGRKIVREESADPGERRWLWNHEDIYKVFRRNSGNKKIQGIRLKTSKMKEVQLHPDTFEKMWNLKFLEIEWGDSEYNNKVRLPKGISAFPDELRYLHWEGYPLESLPANSNLENLVELRLPYSEITELFCDEMPVLGKLREIDLSYCERLCKISNLSRAPNVTRLYLDWCDSLREVSPSICHLSNVTWIHLSYCPKLRSVPDLSDLKSLTILDLQGCSNLETFPKVPRSTEILRLSDTAIKEVLSASVEYLDNLVELDMSGCGSLCEVSSSVCHLSNVTETNFSDCPKPRSLRELSDLKYLRPLFQKRCSNLETFPQISMPRGTKILRLSNTVIKEEEVPSASAEYLDNLVVLDMSGRGNLYEVSSSVHHLSNVIEVNLSNCPKLRILPDLSDLKSLRRLYLYGCSNLKIFPKVPRSIEILVLSGTEIKEVPSTLVEYLDNLVELDMSGCGSLCEVSSVRCLSKVTRINLSHNPKIRSLSDLSDLKSLRSLYLYGCSSLETFPKVPSSTEILILSDTAIKEVPSASVEYLDNLVELHMSGCGSLCEVSSSVRHLSNVTRIDLSNCPKLRSLPDLSDLKSLRSLYLDGCSNLKTFPKVPRSTLFLRLGGTAIKEVPSASMEYLRDLFILDLDDCSQLDLKFLERLDLSRKLNYLYLDKTATAEVHPNGCSNVAEGHAKAALENKRCQEDMPPLMSQLDADEPGRNLGSREMDEGPPRSKRLKSTKHGSA